MTVPNRVVKQWIIELQDDPELAVPLGFVLLEEYAEGQYDASWRVDSGQIWRPCANVRAVTL